MFKNKIFNYVYSLFLLSGIVKVIFSVYNIILPIDLTLIFGVILVIQIITDKKLKYHLSLINKNKRISLGLFMLALFYFWLLLSSIWSPSTDYWSIKLVNILTNFIALLWPILSSRYNERFFYLSFAVISMITGLWFVLFILPNININTNYYAIRTTYLNVSVNSGLSLLILLTQNLEFERKWLKVLFIFSLITSLFLSGGRSGILAAAVLVFIWYFRNFLFNKGRKVFLRRILIFAIPLIGLIFFLNGNEQLGSTLDRSVQRITLLSNIFTEKNAGNSVNERIELIEFTYNEINTSNEIFFFGNGNGSFGTIFNGIDQRKYPHNIFLEIMFELGLVGLILFCTFLFLTTKNIFSSKYIWIFIFVLFQALKSNELGDLRVFFAIIGVYIVGRNWIIPKLINDKSEKSYSPHLQ